MNRSVTKPWKTYALIAVGLAVAIPAAAFAAFLMQATAAAAPLFAQSADAVPPGMTSSGTESAAEWSPEHIGKPEEDWPGFTLIRDVILRPIGIARPRPLPGDRATFYVPRSDDNPRRGRRLMYMRDLACCAGGLAFYSTPTDLVRFGLANGGRVDGQLAGGMVMSLTTIPYRGIVIVVTSNVAHAATSNLALRIGQVFTEQAQ